MRIWMHRQIQFYISILCDERSRFLFVSIFGFSLLLSVIFLAFFSLINSMHLLESGDLSQTINDSQPRNRKPAKNCFQFASSPWFWSGDVIFDRWIVVTEIECFPKKKTKIAEIFFKKTKKIFFFCNLQFQSILFLLHAAVWTT